MGKYGIGARVRDEDGDEGVIVGKSKGERLVRYGADLRGIEVWVTKSFITPIDETPAAAEQKQDDEPKFKVGDRVRLLTDEGEGRPAGSVGTVEMVYDDALRVEFDAPFDGWSGNNSNVRCWHVVNNDVELIHEWQPKVGDRVRFKTENPSHGALYSPNPLTVKVLGDEGRVTVLYDPFDGYEEGGLTQTVQVSDLEPLPVAAQAQPAGPAPAEPAPLAIESGKHYRTRDGRKVGPVRLNRGLFSVTHPFQYETEDSIPSVTAEGRWSLAESEESRDDLIAEWVVPDPVAVAPATATPITKGSLVQLSAPALVTGTDRHHAHLLLGTGGTYTLPVAALVAAA